MTMESKTCTPCRGGIPPLNLQQAQAMIVEAPGWTLIENGTRLRRDYAFNDFASAMQFANKVGVLSEQEGHHPDIRVGWGYCHVEFQTHKIKGLHENDFIMAAKVNALT